MIDRLVEACETGERAACGVAWGQYPSRVLNCLPSKAYGQMRRRQSLLWRPYIPEHNTGS
jgi:hypothetical protein